MGDENKDVQAAPSTDTDVTPESSTDENVDSPDVPTDEGQNQVADDVIKSDRPLENQIREWKRKAEDNEEKYNQLLQSQYDNLQVRQTQQNQQVQQGQQDSATDSMYQEFEEAGIPRTAVNLFAKMSQAQLDANQQQQAPVNQQIQEQSAMARNEAEIDRILADPENKDIVEYREEALRTLTNAPLASKMHKDAAKTALDLAVVRHLPEVKERIRKEAQAKANESRSLRGEVLSGTTITLGSGQKRTLTAEQAKAIAIANSALPADGQIDPKVYLEGLEKDAVTA